MERGTGSVVGGQFQEICYGVDLLDYLEWSDVPGAQFAARELEAEILGGQ